MERDVIWFNDEREVVPKEQASYCEIIETDEQGNETRTYATLHPDGEEDT